MVKLTVKIFSKGTSAVAEVTLSEAEVYIPDVVSEAKGLPAIVVLRVVVVISALVGLEPVAAKGVVATAVVLKVAVGLNPSS